MSLEFTGERFVPGVDGEIWIEHWHRYHFARPLVAGCTVLDVACGEGYGSALLAHVATQVIGIDIAEAAVAHARCTYRAHTNLRFEVGSCTALPLSDASVDRVVSFETLEHIAEQPAFLREVARVLRPDGLFILSSPNKAEYSDRLNYDNTFHVRELYRAELEALIAPVFAHLRWLGQRNAFHSLIWEEGAGAASAEIIAAAGKDGAAQPGGAPGEPLYFLLLASCDASALARVSRRLSIFADTSEWLYNDYRQVYRQLRGLQAQLADLRAAPPAGQTPAPPPVVSRWHRLRQMIRGE